MPTFVEALAPERFSKYRAWSQGDQALALRLYSKNVEVAEALYTPLHTVEISLRNVVDSSLRTAFGDYWFDDPQVVQSRFMQSRVLEARQKLRSLGANLTRGHIIAELSFGFWGGLFGKGQKHLWGRHLRRLFPDNIPLQRSDIASRLDAIRLLRNRVAHHEPIIQLDLNTRYAAILELTGWLSADAAAWTLRQSRFGNVCPPVPIIDGVAINPAALPFL